MENIKDDFDWNRYTSGIGPVRYDALGQNSDLLQFAQESAGATSIPNLGGIPIAEDFELERGVAGILDAEVERPGVVVRNAGRDTCLGRVPHDEAVFLGFYAEPIGVGSVVCGDEAVVHHRGEADCDDAVIG